MFPLLIALSEDARTLLYHLIEFKIHFVIKRKKKYYSEMLNFFLRHSNIIYIHCEIKVFCMFIITPKKHRYLKRLSYMTIPSSGIRGNEFCRQYQARNIVLFGGGAASTQKS